MLSKEYIAGFFDGEGCIAFVINGKSICTRVAIVQRYKPILELIQQQYEGSIYNNGQNCWQWSLGTKDRQEKFLSDILPFLVMKQQEAAIAIAFCSLPKTKTDKDLALKFKYVELFNQARSERNKPSK